jgi:hypothetical protein
MNQIEMMGYMMYHLWFLDPTVPAWSGILLEMLISDGAQAGLQEINSKNKDQQYTINNLSYAKLGWEWLFWKISDLEKPFMQYYRYFL